MSESSRARLHSAASPPAAASGLPGEPSRTRPSNSSARGPRTAVSALSNCCVKPQTLRWGLCKRSRADERTESSGISQISPPGSVLFHLSSGDPSDAEKNGGNKRRAGPARRFVSTHPQLAARRLTLLSASEVSFLSVAFSSSSVFCRMLAQSLRPSCFAQAIRLP